MKKEKIPYQNNKQLDIFKEKEKIPDCYLSNSQYLE